MANAPIHRDKIIQAAVRLYREQGYANTGLNKILKLSGAPKGSLYHYFPGGKEELTIEAIRVAGEIVEKTLMDLAAKTTMPRDFVRAYCTLLAEWMEASKFKSGCPIATTILEMVPFSAPITRVCQAVFDRWTIIIAGVYLKAGWSAEGATEQAEFLIATIEGTLLLARVKQSAAPIKSVPGLMQARDIHADA